MPIALVILDALMKGFLVEYGLVIPLEFQPVNLFTGL